MIKKKRVSDKLNKKRLTIIGVAVVIIILGYFLINSDLLVSKSVEEGDKVQIRYAVWLENGTLIDTNYAEIAQTEGLTSYKTKPFEMIAGGKDTIPGVSTAVIGMKEGEKKELVLSPAEAYGEIDTNRLAKTPIHTVTERFKAIPRYVDLNATVFEIAFQTKPETGKIVKSDIAPWSYEVIEINEDTVRVKARVDKDSSYLLPRMPWYSTAVSVNEDNITFRYEPEEGSEIDTMVGKAKVHVLEDEIQMTLTAEVGDIVNINGQEVVVTGKDDVYLYSNNNHPLAGQTLNFNLEIIEIEKVN